MKAKYDQEFIDNITERLADLPLDRKPLWGSLSAPGVLGHLTESLDYSMGLLGDKPSNPGFIGKRIIRPLILNEILSFPKGVKGVPLPFEEGDVDTLVIAMGKYLETLRSNAPDLKPHPLFGPLTLNEWTQFHILHFQHHMKQFNI